MKIPPRKILINFFERIVASDDKFLNQTEQLKNSSYPIFKKEASSSFIVYKEVRYHHILKKFVRKRCRNKSNWSNKKSYGCN